MGGSHHFCGHSARDISACPAVVLLPIGGNSDVQSFTHGLCIDNQKAFHLYEKGEILMLLYIGLQVLTLFFFSRSLDFYMVSSEHKIRCMCLQHACQE